MSKKARMPKLKTGAQKRKFERVMSEFKAGTLHHGTSGKIVKDRATAIAIAFSEARSIKK